MERERQQSRACQDTKLTFRPCASGLKAGAFGGVALFAVIFYASGIPRVQKDVLQVREAPLSARNSDLP